jgi:D-alanyl-D-alanine carboxypeptidase
LRPTPYPDYQNTLFSQPNLEWDPVELVNIGVDNTVAGCPYEREEGFEACFEPGTNWFYSNTNTVMLELIVEHVTGRPYGELLQEKILEPLGLEGTSHPTTGDLPTPYARGYSSQGLESGRQDTTHWNPSSFFAVGDLVSTFDDMRTWGCALATGQLLSDEMQAERLTEATVGPNAPGLTAYALAIANTSGWWGHEGILPGYNSVTYYRPDIGAGLVVIANTDEGAPARKIASAIIDIAARESPMLGDFEEEVPYRSIFP